jgi:hypothetical protein
MQAPNALSPMGLSQAPSHAHACCASRRAWAGDQAQKSVPPPASTLASGEETLASLVQPGVCPSSWHASRMPAVE